MDIGILGISYKSSELFLREHFAKVAASFSSSLPFVLLSTCNRTEIYFSSADLSGAHSDLLAALKTEVAVEEKLYSYFGKQCFEHLARVTSGADSAFFGEAEVQGQVKRSYEAAAQSRTLSSSLHFLFQKCLKIGKEVRTIFSLPKGSVSLESTLWDLARCFFVQKRPISLLLVGHSEINRKIIHFLKNKGDFDLHLATRHYDSAEDVMKKYEMKLFPWEDMDNWTQFDMVIAGSKSSNYILKANQIRKEKSLIKTKLIVDLSMPRNVDPLIEKNPHITLFNIEEIGGFIEQRQRISLQEKKEIGGKLEVEAARQIEIYTKSRKQVLACV
jgi:glutamyl-tRNA reductase